MNSGTFLQSTSGMLQNGGSSGAAGALQQEMNSDIRDVDLGARTASWEIMALRREMTHVTPQLGAKSIYNPSRMARQTCVCAAFSNCLKNKTFKVIHPWEYLFSTKKCAVCPALTIRVTRSTGQGWD